MAARRIPNPKAGGSSPSGVIQPKALAPFRRNAHPAGSFCRVGMSLWPNWTRRLTTNQKIGGSSPSRDSLFILCSFLFPEQKSFGPAKTTSQMGFEPTIFGSGNRRLVHLATGTPRKVRLRGFGNRAGPGRQPDANAPSSSMPV